jgi:protein-S-isoprenylcysteine O-methyltransferase Ste14
VWAGLSLAFLNPAAALITLVYVTPAYLLYARSEEAMMVESFGDAYVRYRERVPAVLPGLRWSRGRSR